MELEVRTCLFCGAEFKPKRIDKMVCGPKCSSYWSRGKKAKVKRDDDAPEGFRKCRLCHQVKPIDQYYANGANHFRKCKACHNLLNKKRREGKPPVKRTKKGLPIALDELADFIYYIQKKRYWIDMKDSFQLIDIYDRIWPLSYIPHCQTPEETFSKMFIEIIDWWKLKKKDHA
jgi:hypothetical protein